MQYIILSKKKINKKLNNKRLITIFIGGENNHYLFRLKEGTNICDKIKELKKQFKHGYINNNF